MKYKFEFIFHYYEISIFFSFTIISFNNITIEYRNVC